MRPAWRCLRGLLALGPMLLLASCGYHTTGQAVRLPSDLHTLYVPTFTSLSQSYRIEETFTHAVVRELHDRTHYRILTQNDGTADATLMVTITNTLTTPLTYDSVTGRLSTSMVYVAVQTKLVSSKGKVLWDNPNLTLRSQYQVSTNPATFFNEESPALQRVASDFSHLLVSDLLESY